jgi:hypothetical protein
LVVVVELDAERARKRHRGCDSSGSWNWHDAGAEAHEPRERNSLVGHGVLRGDSRENSVPCQALHAFSAKGPVRDQANAIVSAVFGDAVSQTLVVERRQAHLDRCD